MATKKSNTAPAAPVPAPDTELAATAPAAEPETAAEADQPEPAEPEAPPAPEAPEPPAPATEPMPALEDYIAVHEKAAQAVDLVVTAISHPDTKPRHHIGVYSGFPLTTGPLSATYSDGSTH